MESVCVSVGGERILNNLSLTAHKGEIVCLYGIDSLESEALAGLLRGSLRADFGNVYLNDRRFAPSRMLSAGVAGVYVIDERNHFLPNLTIAENIVLGRERRPVHGRNTALTEAMPALQQAGSAAPAPNRPTSACSLMELSLAELAKAFYLRPSLLLFRQAALFNEKDTAEILSPVLRNLTKSGTSVICTTQNMETALLLADSIGFIYHGMCPGLFEQREFYSRRFLDTRAAVERVLSYGEATDSSADTHQKTFQIRSLCGKTFRDLSVTLRSGEILGIFSWNRSALDELILILGGSKRSEGGEILKDGKKLKYRSPHGALRAGISITSPTIHGLYIDDLALADNMLLPAFSRLSLFGIRSRRREKLLEERLAKQTNITINSPGGFSRERAMLARGMASNPDVLILSEPFSGMDYETEIDAISFLHERGKEGTMIIITSTDERMLEQVCSRTLRLEAISAHNTRKEASP